MIHFETNHSRSKFSSAAVLAVTILMIFQTACSDVEFGTRTVKKNGAPGTGNRLALPDAQIIINDGDQYTNNERVAIQLLAPGADAFYLTHDATCASGGEWQSLVEQKNWHLQNLEADSIVHAKFRNAEGDESACVSDSIIHDSIPPVVVVTGANDLVTSSQSGHYGFFGVDAGSGLDENSRTCMLNGRFTQCDLADIIVDNSGVGHQLIVVSLSDRAGNMGHGLRAWEVVHRIGTVSVVIEDGNEYANSDHLQVDLTAQHASEMYVTTDSSCATGGVWEAYKRKVDPMVETLNAENTYYAIFRNRADELSTCESDSIIHDNIPPTVTITGGPELGNIASAIEHFSFELAIEDTGSGLASHACSLNGIPLECENMAIPLEHLKENNYTLLVVALDQASNPGQASFDFEVVAPACSDPSIVINENVEFTNSAQVSLVPSAQYADEMLISADENCATGEWQAYMDNPLMWSLDTTLGQGSHSVYAKFKNRLGETECVSDSIIYDSEIAVELTETPNLDSADDFATVGYSIGEDLSGEASCRYKVDGKNYQSCGNTRGEITLTELAHGEHTITVEVTDRAGNVGTSAPYTWSNSIEDLPTCVIAESSPIGEGPSGEVPPGEGGTGLVPAPCLAFMDDFEGREIIQKDGEFDWVSIVYDSGDELVELGDDGELNNVAVKILPTAEGRVSAEGDNSVYFYGRPGSSVHEVFMVSRALDLTGHQGFDISFQYAAFDLEFAKGKPEYLLVDVCIAAPSECGNSDSSAEADGVTTNWKTIFITEENEGDGLDPANFDLSAWKTGEARVNLLHIGLEGFDFSHVVIRFSVRLDEGIEQKDAVGLDDIRIVALPAPYFTQAP